MKSLFAEGWFAFAWWLSWRITWAPHRVRLWWLVHSGICAE
jgi:hypothetical protein